MFAVDERKLDKLLKEVYQDCLICPPPYDFADEEFTGDICPGLKCDECWKTWLSQETKNPEH